MRPLRSFAASGGAVLCALAVALSLAPLAPASAARGSGRHAASQRGTTTGRADGSHLHHDAGTGVHLAHSFHGAKAIRKLGGDLTTAARINHRSPAQLRHLLTTDPTMWLTTDGRLYVKDELPQQDASGTSFVGSPPRGATPAAPQPLDQTFDLHSLAGAPYTLYLDFDGQDLTGTRWKTLNDSLTSASGWDPAGNGATVFSDGEKAEVQYIWSVVAEDYAPFDIDVTTADPGAEALNRTSSTDAAYGTRVVFTDSKAVWDATCQDNCGGIAFLGAFGQVGSIDPALVFSLGESNDPWYMAAAAAHEAGHTFGLTHDGDLPDTAMTSYDSGHGLWGPIMGDPYNRDVAQWSDGEYANANNQQDDVGILRQDGLAERADEAGGTPASAGGVPSGTAYISGRDDVDLYALGACTGTVAARATPASLSPDLDVDLAIVDAAGHVVASDDPAAADQTHWYARTVNGGASYYTSASGLDASLDAALDGGPYYLRVAGGGGEAGGAGDPVANYDDYGSMGAYQVSVSGCTQPATAPSAPAYARGSMSGSSATVTWSAPTSDGGSAITAYDVEVDGATVATLGADARSYTADGLSAGPHTIAVRARNGVNDGQAATVHVRPLTVPGTPTGLAVVYSGTTATLSWVAPADDGGSPITGYRVVIGSFSAVVYAGSTSITVSGFVPGVSYVVSVAATNELGTGPAGTTTVRVPVAPTAPTALSANADPDGSVTATWHAPSDDGGSPITGYQARLDGGGWAPVSGTSYTFTGGAAGAHTVDVAAINAAGTGPAATTTAVVPVVPGAPTGLALTTDALGRTLTAIWKAPDSDGGSTVTDYQVQVDGGAWHATAGARSYTTDTLTTGDHTVTVRAVNAVGSSVSVSATSTMPAPPTVPGVVRSFATTVDAASGQAQVVWGPPADDGGSAVTGYDVTVDGTTHHLGASATSYPISGITLGHHYAVGVVADNAVGSGPAQGADVVGFLPPGQVGSVSTVASATGRTLAVTWAAPASTGGSSSVTYQVRLGTGDWQDVTDPTHTFTAVVAGPTQVEIRAIGDGGTGDSLVVPVTMPAAPTAPSAPGDLAATIDPASGTGTLHWSAPLSDGGSPVTGYDVTIGGTTTTVTGTSTTLSGLTLGQPVLASVKAINAVGPSTVATTTITWLRAPDAVAGFAVTSDANALTATVTWAAPASDGGSPIAGYDVTLDGNVTHLDASAHSWTATGLALGHDYPVSVVAVSAVGSGPAAGATVRLTRVATAPTLATPTVDPVHDTVALSWTAPGDNGGSAVTGYEIAVDGGAWTSVTGASTTLSDVAEGSHTITVAADNTAGRGAVATVTATMPHRAVPTAVRDLTITPDPTNGSAVVSWVRPVENDSTDPSVLPVTGYWITVSDGTPRWTTGGSYQLLGLHLGDTISVTVAAANVLGIGAPAGASVALVRAPDPVSGLTATVDPTTRTTVHVGWTAPASDGGSPVTGYRVVATGYAPGAGSGVVARDTVVTGTSTDLTGLTLGTAYQITVTAVTAVGTGGANLTTVIPTDVPGAVRGLTRTVNETTGVATVSWSAPASVGGTAITGYTVTVNGVASTLASYAYSYQLHLVAGTTYDVAVAATNAAGIGAASSLTLHPAPGSVVGLAVTPDRESGALAVTWTAPAPVPGATITGYQVTRGDGSWITTSETSYTFTGLSPSWYSVGVRAVTADRTGPATELSAPVQLLAPSTAPATVTGISASLDAGSGSVVLLFTPGSDGGSPVTGYETQVDGDAWAAATATPNGSRVAITLTGLAEGDHLVKIRADNAKGAGASVGIAITMPPATVPTPPGAPGAVMVTTDPTTGTSAYVAWTPPASTGGTPITGYEVSVSPSTGVGGCLGATDATTLGCDLTGLTLGTAYTVSVTAVNDAGVGASATASVTPVIQPGPVTGLRVTADADAGTLVATWDELGYPGNGGAAVTGYEIALDGGATVAISGATTTMYTFTGVSQGDHVVSIYAERGDTFATGVAETDVTMPAKQAVPGAVTVLSAAVSDDASSVRITWGAPVSDGNAAITGYRVAVDGTVVAAGQTVLSYVITGAPLGTAVTVTVTALNARGAGPDSSVSFTPRRVPGAVVLTAQPTLVDDGTRLGSAGVAWPAPADDGGSTIIGYDVSVDGGPVARQSATGYALSGLPLGATHTVAVAAVNALGDGPTRTVTIAAPVTTPTGVGAVQVQQVPSHPDSVLITWAAPDEDGGSAIAGYDVTVGGVAHRVDAPGQSLTLDGLTLGTTYMVTVAAVNGAGLAGASGTVSYTASWTPDAPSGLHAAADRNARTLAVSWDPMTTSGGLPVTGYRVQLDAGDWVQVSGASHTFSDVTTGRHDLAVVAVNDRGTGPAAYQLQVAMLAAQTAPAAVYGLRADVDATALTATVTWSPPTTDGDSAITGYRVTVDGATSSTVVPDPSSTRQTTTIGGLVLGQASTVSVAAVNAIGIGPAQSVTARPVRAPSAAAVTASYDPHTLAGKVSWTPPSDTGGEVTGYDLWINSDIHHLGADQLSYDLADLQAGGEYDFTVIPRNSAGSGPSAGTVIDPFGIPGAPWDLTASVQEWAPGYAELTIDWTPPADFGGAPDLGYKVYIDGQPYTYGGTSIISPGWLPLTLTGDYSAGQTVTVTAYNPFLDAAYPGMGEGPVATVTSTELVPPGAPASVCIGNLDLAAGTAQVHWTPPTDLGNSALTGYYLSASGDDGYSVAHHLPADASSDTLTGLKEGDSYAVLVTARNAASGLPTSDNLLFVAGATGDCETGDPGSGDPGTGDPGTGDPGSGDGTPSATVPSAVVGLSVSADAASGTITATWRPPLDGGGSAITGYVVALDGNQSEVGDVMGTTFSGLTPGIHAVTVWAENAIGRSVAAGTSVQLDAPPPPPPVTHVPPPAPSYSVPSAPGIGKAKPGKKRGKTTVVIAWKPPGATGGRPLTGYQVVVYQIHRHKAKVSERVSAAASAHAIEIKLKRRKGVTYAFTVLAHNAVGWSAASSRSNAVPPR